MKRFWPLVFICAGIFLFIAGFVYQIVFAGIPYQDPTPELSARFDLHTQIASTISWVGVGAFLCGVCGGILRLVQTVYRDFRGHDA